MKASPVPDCPKRRGPPSRRSPPRLSRFSVLRGAGVDLFLLAGYWMVVLAGCRVPDGGNSTVIAPFPGSGSSLPDVGRRVLEGLAAGDHASLSALRLSRDEYVEVVWPELPASDPDLNVPIEYVWADIEARDRRALIRLAPQFEGLAAELEEVTCAGEVEEFETFRVHTDCWVVLRTPPGKHRIQLFKEVVERGAGYKLFRYYDDVLRPMETTDPAGRA